MEPSTGTFTALVCTKKSQSKEKQRRSGKYPLSHRSTPRMNVMSLVMFSVVA